MALRVAAYCRVSSDREEQAQSFESQRRFFEEYINSRPDWTLFEIFADEGASGTATRRRYAFNRMIDCALCGELDLIITKEISRFARNTLDSIYFTRELRRHGVGVVFMNDGINTLDPDAELRLAIMSSIAQEESRRTSERVKWGQKRRMEQGVVFGRSLLGYDVTGGEIHVNEDGAAIVRQIFSMLIDKRMGCHSIARALSEAGIATYTGGSAWQSAVVRKILRNEKYCGDLVQMKSCTPDYLTHEKQKNEGERIVIRDHHTPIVSREVWSAAQRLLDDTSKPKYSRRHALSGKLRCGGCERFYVARFGAKNRQWRCPSCGQSINDEAALALVFSAFQQCSDALLARRGASDVRRRVDYVSLSSGHAEVRLCSPPAAVRLDSVHFRDRYRD